MFFQKFFYVYTYAHIGIGCCVLRYHITVLLVIPSSSWNVPLMTGLKIWCKDQQPGLSLPPVEMSDFHLMSVMIMLPKHCWLCFLSLKTLTCDHFASQKPWSSPRLTSIFPLTTFFDPQLRPGLSISNMATLVQVTEISHLICCSSILMLSSSSNPSPQNS